MPKSREAYPAEFRRRLLDQVRAGRTPEGLAEKFEPTVQSIRNWVGQADRDLRFGVITKINSLVFVVSYSCWLWRCGRGAQATARAASRTKTGFLRPLRRAEVKFEAVSDTITLPIFRHAAPRA
jgi:transposase